MRFLTCNRRSAAFTYNALIKLKALFPEVWVARNLLRLARGWLWAAPLIVVLGLLAALFEGFGLTLFVPLVDALTGATGTVGTGNPLVDRLTGVFAGMTDGAQALLLIGAIVVCIALKAVIQYANTVFFYYIDTRVTHELRQRVFNCVLYGPWQQGEQQLSGQVVNTLQGETWRTSEALGKLFRLTTSLTTVLIFFGLMLALSWGYTLLLVGFSMLTLAVVQAVTHRVKRAGQVAVRANVGFSERMWQSLNGLQLIRGFGREAYERDRFRHASEQVREAFLFAYTRSSLTSPVAEVLTVALIGVAIAVVVLRGDNLAALVGFLVIAYRAQPRITQMLNARTELALRAGSVEQVVRTLRREPAPPPAGLPFERLEQELRFESVGFRYPGEPADVLEDVSLRLGRGTLTGVVGPSGAGKSTLVGLLLRLHLPTRGAILVDGVPLEQIDLTAWRQRIAFVPQDAYIFNASVHENIAYGRLDADEGAVREAAALACAQEFIEALPEGYDTLIGDRGVRLSHGQRQRIALARALIRRPTLLLLDEATNALDGPTEATFRQAVEALRPDTTIVVIAHRLATIKGADHVVVLENGRIVQQGPLDRLSRADDGAFRRLSQGQLEALPGI